MGRGALGTVYAGVDDADGGRVAVKLVGGEVAEFEAAARVLQALSHPSIVAYVDHGFDAASQRYYLAMRYVDGVALTKRMTEVISTRLAVRIARDVAEGLAHAHDRGVLHRDLKPENVMLTRRDGSPDRAVVLDFGIARWGTPLYMAPEQWREEELTGATDVYALGVMLFELLEGKAPFLGESIDAVRRLHLAPLPPQHSPFTPPALRALVEQMLAKSPSDRPTMHALVSLFEEHALEEAHALEEESWIVTEIEPSS